MNCFTFNCLRLTFLCAHLPVSTEVQVGLLFPVSCFQIFASVQYLQPWFILCYIKVNICYSSVSYICQFLYYVLWCSSQKSFEMPRREGSHIYVLFIMHFVLLDCPKNFVTFSYLKKYQAMKNIKLFLLYINYLNMEQMMSFLRDRRTKWKCW